MAFQADGNICYKTFYLHNTKHMLLRKNKQIDRWSKIKEK